MTRADLSSSRAGVVVVDKPRRWTSHDVVARVRRLAGTRRVGHSGTLDPMATGVLVVGLSRATRLLGHLALGDKSYHATVRLGVTTLTDDAEGEVIRTADARGVAEDAIAAAMAGLVGNLRQVPPAVSAIKVDGRRSYARVRQGEPVELAARPVHVAAFDLLRVRRAGGIIDLEVTVTCSTGTYVRALARDLGDQLSVGGHLIALRRTRVGPFCLSEARTLERLETELVVVPMDEVARRCFPAYRLDEQQATAVSFGQVLPDIALGAAGPTALFAPDGRFVALYEQHGPDARAVAVFT